MCQVRGGRVAAASFVRPSATGTRADLALPAAAALIDAQPLTAPLRRPRPLLPPPPRQTPWPSPAL
jgi:hypothetical protein